MHYNTVFKTLTIRRDGRQPHPLSGGSASERCGPSRTDELAGSVLPEKMNTELLSISVIVSILPSRFFYVFNRGHYQMFTRLFICKIEVVYLRTVFWLGYRYHEKDNFYLKCNKCAILTYFKTVHQWPAAPWKPHTSWYRLCERNGVTETLWM